MRWALTHNRRAIHVANGLYPGVNWVGHNVDGKGVMVLLNGDVYDGNLNNDFRKEGEGIFLNRAGENSVGKVYYGSFNAKGLCESEEAKSSSQELLGGELPHLEK